MADYQCCWCKERGKIHVHHIIPRHEDGLDDIDNAAPLCPGCHSKYGENPDMRKLIKEMRNTLYKRVENQYKDKDYDCTIALHNLTVRMQTNDQSAIFEFPEKVMECTKIYEERIGGTLYSGFDFPLDIRDVRLTDEMQKAGGAYMKEKGDIENPDYYKALGQTRYYEGNYTTALELFEKALQIKPNTFELISNKGVVLDRVGRYGEALRCFNQAININPKYAKAHFNKGWALRNLEQFDDALTAFNEGLAIDSTDERAWSHKGYLLIHLERYDEALVAIEKCLELNPDYAYAIYNKACIHARRKEKANALKELERAISLDPGIGAIVLNDGDFNCFNEDPDYQAIIKKQ